MKILFIVLSFVTLNVCTQKFLMRQNIYKTKFDAAIPVLNVATFHMRETFDATSTEFW
jgi:hypothetical protein